MFEWQSTPEGLVLEGELDIASVETLHSVLSDNSADGSSLTLDLTQVVRLDTAAAQVLTALIKSREKAELVIILSPEAKETVASLGLNPLFDKLAPRGAG